MLHSLGKSHFSPVLISVMCFPLFNIQMTQDQNNFMREAINLAKEGMLAGNGGPFGCVIVKDGKIVGQGSNMVLKTKDPTAHAEVVALREAAARAGNYRLDNSTLYVTLEPCTMCVGALVHARVARVVFAASEPKAGSLVSARRQLDSGYYNHVFQFQGGLLAEEAGAMLSDFFRRRRAAQKSASGNEQQ